MTSFLLRRRGAPLALAAACSAIAACGATPDANGGGDSAAREPGEVTRTAAAGAQPAANAPATVSGECARLSPDDAAAAIERLQGVGALGDWTIYSEGRTFACSEPFLGDRVECELAPGARAALTSTAGELLIFENSTDLVVSAHIGPGGVACVATDAGVRAG